MNINLRVLPSLIYEPPQWSMCIRNVQDLRWVRALLSLMKWGRRQSRAAAIATQ